MLCASCQATGAGDWQLVTDALATARKAEVCRISLEPSNRLLVAVFAPIVQPLEVETTAVANKLSGIPVDGHDVHNRAAGGAGELAGTAKGILVAFAR